MKTVTDALISLTPVGDAQQSADAFSKGQLAKGIFHGAMAIVGVIPGEAEGKAALSALMKDAAENPRAWRTIGAFTEQATSKGLKGGTSIQKIIENESGDRLVQHTLLDRSGNVVEQHYRPMYKPRDIDKP